MSASGIIIVVYINNIDYVLLTDTDEYLNLPASLPKGEFLTSKEYYLL